MRNRRYGAEDRERAKRLRCDATFPERLLWSRLRAGRLGGVRFRRQEPIGPYVADFCCPSARLVIELDGRSHTDPDRDAERDRWLLQHGWRVVHYGNDEVLRQIETVVAAIWGEVGQVEG